MARFCTSCGAEISENASFCPTCGKPTLVAPPPGGPVAITTSSSGLSDNVAGALAYLLIPAIIFLVVEPYNKNKFIRFHSFQSIFYEVAWIVVNVCLTIVLPWTLWALHSLVSLAFFIGWVIMAIKAYQGQMFKMPVIGDLAEKQANG